MKSKALWGLHEIPSQNIKQLRSGFAHGLAVSRAAFVLSEAIGNEHPPLLLPLLFQFREAEQTDGHIVEKLCRKPGKKAAIYGFRWFQGKDEGTVEVGI